MSFVDFARAHNLDIVHPRSDAKIVRCPTVDKPRSLNGAYWWNGERGWVFDWSGEQKVQWYSDPNAKPWTPEEKAQWRRQQDENRAKERQAQAAAAEVARQMIAGCEQAQHDYLRSKRIDDVALVLDGELIVPMRNVQSGAIQGVQRIYRDGEAWSKKMLAGMRAKDAVFALGSSTSEAILCEGYATGLSLKKAVEALSLPISIHVCFSSGNLVNVANQIRARRKYVFADNDRSQTGQKAAQATGLPWTMSEVVGWDANDVMVNEGIYALAHMVSQMRLNAA